MSGKPEGWQAPTNGERASTISELWGIITHPAFRLGFLDAQCGLPISHDRIGSRIENETPASFFSRMKAQPNLWEGANRIQLAQYRYEEGRLAVLQEGLKCRKWGHPDFPPAAVRRYVMNRVDRSAARTIAAGFSIANLKTASIGPLFERHI